MKNSCQAGRLSHHVARRLPRLPAATAALVLFGIGATAERATAQTSPSGPNTRQLPAIPANSPPVFHGFLFNGVSCGTSCTLLSYNFSSQQPWVTVVSSTVLPPSNTVLTAGMSTGYTVDVSGLAPGTYCAFYSLSWNAQGPAYIGPGTPPPLLCAGGPQQLSGSVCVDSQPPFTLADQITVTAPVLAIILVDPVPDLVNGNAVKTSSQLQSLLTKGRAVSGVAADGVTQLVVRIDTDSPGHQFTATLLDDQGLSGPNIIASEDGALDSPGGTSFSSGQLTVTAGAADSNGTAHAFAVYRAPVDFARPTGSGFKSGTCQGSTKTDDQLGCRAVSLQIQDITANTPPITQSITIIRSPIILIYGLWGNMRNWDNFGPLVTGAQSADSRFSVGRVNYNYGVGALISSPNPNYQNVARAAANSLGFRYNADRALRSSLSWINTGFKMGTNPAGVPVAAVQADVVGHSMGGDIARTFPLLPEYSSQTAFGQGLIHKLITIDTPHLGSPLAANLLLPQNACTRGVLALGGNYAFSSVQLAGQTVFGAIGDLAPSSGALNAINNPPQPQPHPLPTALVAGIYANFASLNCTVCWANVLRTSSTFGCPNDPLARSLTQQGWPAIFGENNDAIVGLSSQLNTAPGSTAGIGFQFTGYVHSQGTEKLSFTGPSVLDPDVVAPQTISISNRVINLLNTPVTNSTVFQPLNP